MQDVALEVMSYKTMSYYASGADDELSGYETVWQYANISAAPSLQQNARMGLHSRDSSSTRG